MLQATEADIKLWYFFHFYLETELDISFKLSPLETIWMKCQTLFSRNHNKNFWRGRLPELKVSVTKVKEFYSHDTSFWHYYNQLSGLLFHPNGVFIYSILNSSSLCFPSFWYFMLHVCGKNKDEEKWVNLLVPLRQQVPVMNTLETPLYIGKIGICHSMHYFSYFSSKTWIVVLRPPHWGSSNEHLQCIIEANIRKISLIFD